MEKIALDEVIKSLGNLVEYGTNQHEIDVAKTAIEHLERAKRFWDDDFDGWYSRHVFNMMALNSYDDLEYLYRWHDLRRNPDDTPDKHNCDWVYVQVEEVGSGYRWIPRLGEYRNGTWWTAGGVDDLKLDPASFTVIAWQQIFPFEVPATQMVEGVSEE